MKTLFSVHGDHPVLKRIDEKNLDEREASFLITDLKNAKYENINADVTVVIQEGDSFTITKDFFDLLKYSRSGNCPTKECDLKKAIVFYAFKEYGRLEHHRGINKKLPITVEFSPMRLARDHGHMACKWSNQEEKTNSYMFDGVEFVAIEDKEINTVFETFYLSTKYPKLVDAMFRGGLKVTLKVEQPVFTEKPIIECDDDILSEREKVVKSLIKSGYTEEKAWDYLKPILTAMQEHGIVFYIP